MIVDEPRLEEKGGRATRSARVRGGGREFRLAVTMPSEFAAQREDASPFLCATLLLAMRLGEDLDVRGPVSGTLLRRAPTIVERYASWDPRLHRSRVTAAGRLRPGKPGAGIGCFFSRGVDSHYSAATPRAPSLTHLIFCDRLEPLHSSFVRAEEIRLSREAADRLGVPLVVMDTNLRELSDPLVRDWADMVGAGLAFLAAAMAGGFGHVVIPSSDGPLTIGPNGTSPLLDHLYATDEVRIEHDTPLTRPAKVAWLARERADLLRGIKVCFHEDRPDNCGRCSKCLLTMLALEATGSLGLADGFPDAIDREALAELSVRGAQPEYEFAEVERALRARDPSLADDVAAALARGRALPVVPPPRADSPGFRTQKERRALLDAPHIQPGERMRRHGGRPPVPRTSVLVPAYQAETTLREAVFSVLGQTAGELELLVVDDGSTIPAAEVLADVDDPRLRLLRHPRNRGLSAARNTALAAARAPLVSQLDADDAWEADYVESILPCFEDPEVGLAYSNCTIVGHPEGAEDFIVHPSLHPIHSFPKLAEWNPVPCPTATMRTEAVRSVGGYPRWLRQCEDYYLYMKLAHAGWRFAYVDRHLARYRWPDAGRGMSYDKRRHELWQGWMFGSFVARHPRTPGPRRRARLSARRELDLARDVARRRVPALGNGRPRLLVEPGSLAMLNLGDIAMLQACVERLCERWPHARIGVVTSAPDQLAQHCPGVEAVPAAGQDEWLERHWQGGPYWPLLAPDTRGRFERLAVAASRGSPRAARLCLRTELLAREPVSEEAREFLRWLLGMDALVVSGRGGTTDVFLEDGLQVLDLIRTATAIGAPTAMFGQGLGPIEDDRLHARARAVLPGVNLIAVRERRSAVPLLSELGVPPERATVTGDDALEAAHRVRPKKPPSGAIGVGLRLAEYSGVHDEGAQVVAQVLRREAARRDTPLRPVTISRYPHETDAGTARRLFAVDAADATTPEEAMVQAGSSRVVVAGSYHAAVFALAQGVPVVGLSATPYYHDKLAGLADLFPGGCTVLSLDDRDLPERLAAALDDGWSTAGERRPALVASAERQIAAARVAYARFQVPAAGASAAGNGIGPTLTQVNDSSASASRYL